MATTTPTPWHLWVIAIVALLWHAGGANDYIQVQSGNADYIGQMSASYGVTAQQVMTYYENWPFWVHSAWAIGIWGGVLGCLLLLFRSRFAYHAFIASLLGAVVTFIYRTARPLEGVELSTAGMIFTAAIFAVTILLIIYSRRLSASGVLR